jgi:hypothetical protein
MANTRSDQRIIVGGVPRAELLPPEIKLEEKGRAQRRLLGFVVVLVLAVMAGGYVLTVLVAETSKQRLATSSAYTDELLAKQAEFVKVRQLAAQVQASKDAATIGMATDIDWTDYLELVDATITQSGAIILSSTLNAETPIVPLALPTSSLEQPRVAEYVLVVTTPEYPIYSSWLDALAKLPAFADATITNIKLETTGYEATLTLHISSEAFTNRFADDVDAETTDDSEVPN